MAQPLRSEDPTPRDSSFSHFGVLNDGTRSKRAAATSITINILVALVIIVLGAVAKTNPLVAKRITELTMPTQPKPEPPPAPKPPPPPPKPLPPVPKIVKIDPPKIKMPEPEKVPELKPVVVPTPKPVVSAPAPPKIINPTPAPKAVSLAAAPAAVVNHDAHPTAVRLGQPDSPLSPLSGPAVARVNMGVAGMPGMNAANSGNGPRATKVSMGSGSPNGNDLNGNGTRAVAGVKMGCIGCTGPLNSTNYSNAPKQVQLQTAAAPPAVRQPEVHTVAMASPPKVTYKPTPAYTTEAKSLHLEGAVSIKIRVTSEGSVQVLSVTRGLGHGLDQSAVQAIEATRFQPAKDTTGRPIDWEGVVNVNFQMS